jgi:hypothetical protein
VKTKLVGVLETKQAKLLRINIVSSRFAVVARANVRSAMPALHYQENQNTNALILK